MAKNPTILIPITLLLILTILSPIITAIPTEALTNAAETLQNSGYIAMSLTLNHDMNSLLAKTTSATIFAPPDLIFAHFGQPSLSLIQYHFSPLIFSSSSLRSLITRTRIPTMLSDHYLIITSTSSSDHISINNVRVTDSPIFDDGILAVFGVENFFDPDFRVADAPAPIGGGNGCRKMDGGDQSAFHDAGNVLISRGYSVMASFLNLQLLGLGFEGSQSQSQRNGLTIFAPVDEVMVDYSDRFPDYPSLFLRHVLPCKVSLNELVSIENGPVLSLDTFLNGFRVNVTRSGVTLKVNEVNIVFPDMYYSDWLVIHGVSDVISVLELEEDFDESDDDLGEPISPVGSSRGPDGDL